jgi:site-specific DNA-methyltransferase (adenine-specific)
MKSKILVGDTRTRMSEIVDGSIQCVVTSPPYWGLRDYGYDGQIGLEQSPDEYVAEMVGVFKEVWRVLRDDGVLWLNLGDTYSKEKLKNLVGIPWRVAFALQDNGWYLRQDIIWAKPNPMP